MSLSRSPGEAAARAALSRATTALDAVHNAALDAARSGDTSEAQEAAEAIALAELAVETARAALRAELAALAEIEAAPPPPVPVLVVPLETDGRLHIPRPSRCAVLRPPPLSPREQERNCAAGRRMMELLADPAPASVVRPARPRVAPARSFVSLEEQAGGGAR